MSALTRVTVLESKTVFADVTFECPREIAELLKTLYDTLFAFVKIIGVQKVSDCDREYGIEEPGTYMIWEEEDGTKKSYKLKNYSREEFDDEYGMKKITLDDETDDDDEECLRCDWCGDANKKVRVLLCDECGDANEKVKFCNNLNHSHYNINCNNLNHSRVLICEYCDVPAKCI
jgi:hypothetical protein